MTYKELYEKAASMLDRGEITLGDFNKMVKPLDVEIHHEPHWIPVEQELPKIGEYVLCGTKAQYFGKYHVCKFVDKDKWIDKPHFDWDRNGFPHVVAWTRFEPYKGVTE